MTIEIIQTLFILAAAVMLFATEIIRADLVGLLVMVFLVFVDLVGPEESLLGFANPAVVTTWAVFILSSGLAKTGIAGKLANLVLRFAGKSDNRLLLLIMSSTAAVSAFVINVGVVALYLPTTIHIARKTGRTPSKLLMPMVFGTILGGMIVMIGTASNLVVIEFLRDAGYTVPGIFSFAPVGLAILAVSMIYMVLLGRRLLPERKSPSINQIRPTDDFKKHYDLEERMALITIPPGNPLAGKNLSNSRFGRALGLNILSVIKENGIRYVPEPDLVLEEGDRLLALGRLDALDQISGKPVVLVENDFPDPGCLYREDISLIQLEVSENTLFDGRSSSDLAIRQELGMNLLALRRGDTIRRTNLSDIIFRAGDRLLLRGSPEAVERLRETVGVDLIEDCDPALYNLEERLLYLRIPPESSLAGSKIVDASFSGNYGFHIITIVRDGEEDLLPGPQTVLRGNDLLIISGRTTDIEVMRGHQTLDVERNPRVNLEELETGELIVAEAMLSPHTSLTGRTLRQLNFREKFGLSVLAIWRGDRAYRTGLNDIPLQFGDTLLCYGSRDKFTLLAGDPDFVVLNLEYREVENERKAPIAGLIMAAVLILALLNVLPIYIAAIAGAIMMVLTGCISIDDAYRSIEWKAIFLIATMLPLGMAMQRTGAASLIAGAVISLVGYLGPTAILAGLMSMTIILNQFVPSAVNAVVMAPIAIATASNLDLSPYPFIMGIAYAVAASFMTPVSHPVNLMIMSPGGYSFGDYVKNGLPITLIVLVVSIVLLPLVFPF